MSRKTICALFAVLCGAPGAGVHAQIAFDDVFTWTGNLVLEDRPDALNAAPELRPDRENGWLVTDRMEGQVRGYDATGRLIFRFGRKGRGPGEFRGPVGAARIDNGRIATVDSDGRIGIWSGDGVLEREFTVQIAGITAATFVAPNTLALASTPQVRDPEVLSLPLLHFVSLEEGRILASVIAPAMAPSEVGAWVTIRGAMITDAGDRFLFTTPLVDSIWEFHGAAERPVAITAIRHPLLEQRGRIPDGHADPAAFVEWVRNASFVIGAVPAGPGHYVVRLMKAREDPRLLLVDAASGEAVEIEGSPSLVAYDARTSAYVFRDPASLESNRFRIAVLRRAG